MSKASVTTTKTINLAQLTQELGAGLCGPGEEKLKDGTPATITVADSQNVTQAALEAAIAAHVAVFPPTRQERIGQVVDAAPDWKTGLKNLAAEGLV